MSTLKLPVIAALAAILVFCTGCQETGCKPQDSATDQRVDSLLSALTLEEKTGLMMNSSRAVPRLGIKAYNWWNEALHGVARNGSATVFPMSIAMAASFDDELLLDVFTAVSDEARAKNAKAAAEGEVGIYEGLTFWTPNINIFRDPRWGRGMETYGEDPYLTGVMGMAVVHGLQGPDDSPVRKAHACAKHFAVHSGPESSRHSFDASVSERDLRETYLPAFKDLVTKAGVEEVMIAYNRFRGVPCGASEYLVKDILRGEWGYKGLITSDCGAVNDFYEKGRHEVVETAAEATAMAIRNGVDTECGSVYWHIPEAVEQGLLTEEDIDACLRRLLSARIKLGEMDGINPWSDLSYDMVEGAEHKALALKMAEETVVLLQNRGGILPLAPGAKYAVLGPNADDSVMMWGNYNPVPKSTVTLLDALKARCPELQYNRACGLIGSEFEPEKSAYSDVFEMSVAEQKVFASRMGLDLVFLLERVEADKSFRKVFRPSLDVDSVIESLEGIDTVIFAGGISPNLEGEEMPVHIPGFAGGDRTDIELPAVQRTLLAALHDAGKKVIFINFSGSAIGLVPETESCDAIVQAWYPGQMGGEALARVLYGEVNPSGKLPVTFYKSIDQLPDFSDYDMAGHTYRFLEEEPLFPFGYGMSYTDFQFGKPVVNKHGITVPVTNAGTVDGDEVVQLYVSKPDDAASPIRTLRGFRRVSVPAGETVDVTIPLTDDTFVWWDERAGDMKPLRGRYTLEIGSSSGSSELQAVEYRY